MYAHVLQVAVKIKLHAHAVRTGQVKLMPYIVCRVANVGASEFFRTEASVPAQFDKILFMTALNFIAEPKLTFEHARKTLKQTGKMLIVHRAAPMCTLPLFSEARERMLQYDQSYLDIIKDLQAIGCDVQWEIECLTIRMRKMRWLAMVHEKFPTEFEAISSHEILSGLRELSEGVMKYSDDVIEFPDRLMFITAQWPIMDTYPTVGRKLTDAHKQNRQVGSVEPATDKADDLLYRLDITKDVRKVLQQKEHERQLLLEDKNKRQATASGILP